MSVREEKCDIKGDYGFDSTLTPAVYHLFADANLADGRGNTVGGATTELISWLHMLKDSKYATLVSMVGKRWNTEISEKLLKCLPVTDETTNLFTTYITNRTLLSKRKIDEWMQSLEISDTENKYIWDIFEKKIQYYK